MTEAETNPTTVVETAARAILASDPDALSNLKGFAARLGDRAPAAKRESRILTQAIADGASQLRAATGDRQIVRGQLVSRLENEHGYRADLAQWAVSLVDRLIHGGNGGVQHPSATSPERTQGHPTDFRQATPHAFPVSAAAVEETGTAARSRMGVQGWILSAIIVTACAVLFGIAADGIQAYSVYSSYAFELDQQVEHAIWMLGYSTAVGAPFGLLAGMQRLAHVAAAFCLAFLVVGLISDIPAAVGRLFVLLPSAGLAVAAAASVKRTDRASLSLGMIALAAVIVIGLHMTIGTLVWGIAAESQLNVPKLASGIFGAAVSSAVGAYIGMLLFRYSIFLKD